MSDNDADEYAAFWVLVILSTAACIGFSFWLLTREPPVETKHLQPLTSVGNSFAY